MPEPKLGPIKDFDPNDPNPCASCSHCCEYISLEIDKPTTVKDFDYLVWYLIHKDVWVYIDDENDWYIQFNTPCDKLDNQRCGYYPHRPTICRDYEPESCLRYGEGEPDKYMFKNEIDLFDYMKKKWPKTYIKLKKKINVPGSGKPKKPLKAMPLHSKKKSLASLVTT